ncbi:hypothetical protein IHE44_0006787, partial [Lamprotornis superbus]
MPRKLLLPYKSVFSHFRAPRGLHDSLAMNAARSGYRVFSANSTAASTELAKKITERLGAELGKSVVYQETNGETRVEIKESVRGQDIFIIQTIPRDVNTAVMELLIMAYALKTSCARNIIGVIPYFPYSKQSKMRKRGSIVCKLLASMLAKAGLTHIITMDLHQKEIQGFFSFPVDNLRASPFLLQYIQEEIPDYRNAVIVAKSPGAAKRAQSYAERLRLGLAVIHGEAQCTEQDMDDGRHSPPMLKNATVHPGLELPCKIKLLCLPLGGKKKNKKSLVGNLCWFICMGVTNLKAIRPRKLNKEKGEHLFKIRGSLRELKLLSISEVNTKSPQKQNFLFMQQCCSFEEKNDVMMAKEKPPITVVGDVGGRIAIIVDDIIDDVESFVAAAEILKERGAYKIFVMATHGLLSADAPRLIEESSIDEVVVTNTVPHEVQKLQCPKIKTVDISLILSEAIRRIHNGESMAYLFRNITRQKEKLNRSSSQLVRREQRLLIAVWAARAAFGSTEGNVQAVLLAELSQQQLHASSVASPLLHSRAGTFIKTKGAVAVTRLTWQLAAFFHGEFWLSLFYTLLFHSNIYNVPRGQQQLSRTSLEHQANKWTSACSAWTTFSIQHGLNLHAKFREGCAGLGEVSKLLMGFPAFSKYHKQISVVLCDHILALQPGGDVWASFLLSQCWTMFFILEASVRSVSSIAGLFPSNCLSDLPGARLGLIEGCCPIQVCFCWAVFGIISKGIGKSRLSIEVKVPQSCWRGSLCYLIHSESKLKSQPNQSKPKINPKIIYIESEEGGKGKKNNFPRLFVKKQELVRQYKFLGSRQVAMWSRLASVPINRDLFCPNYKLREIFD